MYINANRRTSNMAYICRDIVNQFHACAALISDPGTLRRNPQSVADALTSAFNKIEQLQSQIPSTPPCDCPCAKKQVIDPSILTGGIRPMVLLALKKQLEPLHNEFPVIIRTDFKTFHGAPDDDSKENFVEREIKETNCMAAMVLLYYYLGWHVLLILLNKPFQTEDLDKDPLIHILRELPRSVDFLEFRHIHSAFKEVDGDGLTDTARRAQVIKLLVENQVAKNMGNDTYKPNEPYSCLERNTKLIPLYRRLIYTEKENKYKSTFIDAETFEALITDVQIDYVNRHMAVFGNVFSLFHVNESTTKWHDMVKPIKVTAKDTEGKTALHEFYLRDVLSSMPFTAPDRANAAPIPWHAKAVPLCIHDYNSSSLMIDICKSAWHLNKLLAGLVGGQRDAVPALFSKFITQFCANEPGIEASLSTPASKQSRFTHTYFKNFISESPNTFRVDNGKLALDGTSLITQYTVDAFPSYYVSSGPINLHNSNHVYLAAPGVKIKENEASFLKRVQSLLAGQPASGDTIRDYVAPLVKNSLVTSMGLKSAFLLLEKSKDLPLLQPHAPFLYPSTDLFQTVGTLPTRAITREDIKSMLKSEVDAYEALQKQFEHKRPFLMPGFSWPVAYDVGGANASTNRDKFDVISYIPEVLLGNTREIVVELRNIAGKLPKRP